MRYTPFETMERMFDQMRREMWDYDHSMSFDLNTNLSEEDGEFVLTIDLPGFDRDEIDLRVVNDELHLSANHESESDSSSHRRSVSEQISLPKPVVDDDCTATYHNGVLEVHLPIVAGSVDRGAQIDIAE